MTPPLVPATVAGAVLLGRAIAGSPLKWLLEAPDWVVGPRPARSVREPHG